MCFNFLATGNAVEHEVARNLEQGRLLCITEKHF